MLSTNALKKYSEQTQSIIEECNKQRKELEDQIRLRYEHATNFYNNYLEKLQQARETNHKAIENECYSKCNAIYLDLLKEDRPSEEYECALVVVSLKTQGNNPHRVYV